MIATRDYISDPSQEKFLGLYALGTHLRDYASTTGLALAAIGWIALAAGAVERLGSRAMQAAVAGIMVAGLLWLGFSLAPRDWLKVGACLPVLVLLVMGWETARYRHKESQGDRALRLLLIELGASLLIRMAFNARIYDLGFYQAALATVVIVAFLLGEFPRMVASQPSARAVAIAGVIALIGSGVLILANENRLKYGYIDYPVSEGKDRFYTYRPEVLAQAQVLADITTALRKTKRGQSLLVLPEGEMINYLARMPSPLAQFYFFSVVTEGGKERQLVNQLSQRPPDWVLLVSRDLREFGIQHYGERAGAGKELVDWVKQNYDSIGTINGEPMDYRRHGLQLFRKRGMR